MRCYLAGCYGVGPSDATEVDVPALLRGVLSTLLLHHPYSSLVILAEDSAAVSLERELQDAWFAGLVEVRSRASTSLMNASRW